MRRHSRCPACGNSMKECTCATDVKKIIGPVYCGVMLPTKRPCPNLFDIGFRHQDGRYENRCYPCNNRIMASDPYELEKNKEIISVFRGGAYDYFGVRNQM